VPGGVHERGSGKSDNRFTAAVLQSLKGVGVRLALDDFCTGYSNLSYLKRFPVDILKIDRCFVTDVAENVIDASIVSAVITMGRRLHLSVVAEGVETPRQLAFLRAHDCPRRTRRVPRPPAERHRAGYVRSHTDTPRAAGRLNASDGRSASPAIHRHPVESLA
jgi:predicted signal transduction protein with EAL and GGDEF domain